MNWQREGYDVMTLHTEDGEYAGYYIVRHKMPRGYWYNAWKGDHNERHLREYITAGYDVEACKKACEERG